MGEVLKLGARLTISSKNYSSWSLRGWLMAKLSGLPFEEEIIPPTDPSTRAELLLLSPSMLVPCLHHAGLTIWNSLAIGEYLNEIRPEAELHPRDAKKRARCRSISGEMQSGFHPLRSALPMNIKGDYPTFKVWTRAQADIDRIVAIWTDCLDLYGGPYLFGARPTIADAMYAPVVTRLKTYHVRIDDPCARYCTTILALPQMQEWIEGAQAEAEEIEELEMEF